MTQENKELLLKDLCARLSYSVILNVTLKDKYDEIVNRNIKLTDNNLTYITRDSHWRTYKPYLRPMSSMTEEESNELESITFPLMEKDWDANENPACIRWIDVPKYMDFILSHHFDYQGLIEKGLAIEVNEQNNPYK